MKNKQEHWKLFYDTTKALFVLNDELSQYYNWYYQELYYIKLVSFIDESIKYIEDVKAILGCDNILNEWLDCVRVRIDTILSTLTEDELVYIHYRRTRAAHMFQHGYECEFNSPQKIVVRIRQMDNTIKQYSCVDANTCIDRVESCYKRSDIFDKYLDMQLYPVLTNIRCDLNRVNKKISNSINSQD